MEAMDILKQLYFDHHLEKEDLEKAKKIVHVLNIRLKNRV